MDVYKNVPNSSNDSTHNFQLLHLTRNLIKKKLNNQYFYSKLFAIKLNNFFKNHHLNYSKFIINSIIKNEILLIFMD